MKDHANFLRAAALLANEHPDVHFLLAGRGVDEENSKLLGTVRELGLLSRTHLLGERRDISRLTAALDILSLSSLYGEGFPIIVGEAMACGVPCVVTAVGDSAWLVGDTGRIAQPGNPLELSAAWKDLIVMGAEGRRILGIAARTRVATNFSLPSIVQQYETLFQDTIRAAASETNATTKTITKLTDSAWPGGHGQVED
jgi:glycosyltransferase involved in cell wall biosynthesis